jgi:hypothetical protein
MHQIYVVIEDFGGASPWKYVHTTDVASLMCTASLFKNDELMKGNYKNTV